MPEEIDVDAVNPYAPTAKTSTSHETTRRQRHPARWPLLIVGAVLVVPMVWTLAEFVAGFNEIGPLIASSVLFFLGLTFQFLASTTYTRLTRGLTLLLCTLILGMILSVTYRGFGWIVLIIYGLFGWIAVLTFIRAPDAEASDSESSSV